MSVQQGTPADKKWRERRRGVRLNSSVQVEIVWRDSLGAETRQSAQTCMVSPYGCLVVLRENLVLDQPVQLTNRANSQTAQAVVVWKGRERSEGWELGIELLKPEMDFWGMDL